MPAEPLLGFHVSIAGSVDLAVDRAVDLGCTTFQIFTRNPRGWKFAPLDEAQAELFAQKRKKAGFEKVVAHMPYLPNLATSVEEYQKKSRDSLTAEMSRCGKLGVDYLVAHIGYHGGKGVAAGVRNVVDSCNEAIGASESKTTLLVETAAGQSGAVGSRFEEVRAILDGVREQGRIGVCIDTCLPPGSAVFRDCAPTPIEDIMPGDLVTSHDGTQVPVTHVMSRSYSGDLIHVKPKGLPWIRMTPEHPVLCVKRGRIKWLEESPWRLYPTEPPSWLDASHLEKGIYLVMPRLKSRCAKSVNFGPYTCNHTRRTAFPAVMPITEKLATLMGLYLAEGFTFIGRDSERSESGKVYLAFGKHEKRLIAKTIHLFEEIFSLKAWTDETETGIKVCIGSNILARFFKKNFGDGARSKRIPSFIMRSEAVIVSAFLLGYLRGDGNVNEEGIRFVTTSKSVAYQLIHLLARLDIRATFGVHKPTQHFVGERLIRGNGWFEVHVGRNDSRKLGFKYRLPTAPQRTVLRNEDSFYVPIGMVRRERYNGKVYNLTTASGTFLAPFIVTHNCHIFAAGFDISNEAGVEHTMGLFEDIVGYDRLKVVHLNDSKGPVGSHLDRHQYIGEGHIGKKGVQAFLRYRKNSRLPLLMEIPTEDVKKDEENLKLVKSLIAG